MVFLYALFIAGLIVTGQALWKAAVVQVVAAQHPLLSMAGITKLLLTPKLLFGVLSYGLATLLYIYLLSKNNYFQLQSLVVGGSLVLTLLIASLVFKESPSVVNIIGVGFIIFGSLLVTFR